MEKLRYNGMYGSLDAESTINGKVYIFPKGKYVRVPKEVYEKLKGLPEFKEIEEKPKIPQVYAKKSKYNTR